MPEGLLSHHMMKSLFRLGVIRNSLGIATNHVLIWIERNNTMETAGEIHV
jgi:hypothetical protein